MWKDPIKNFELKKKNIQYLLEAAMLYSEKILAEAPENFRQTEAFYQLQQAESIKSLLEKDNIGIYSIQLIFSYLSASMGIYRYFYQQSLPREFKGDEAVFNQIRKELKPLEDFINHMQEVEKLNFHDQG